MTKPYDAAMKQLLDDFAIDWVDWLAPRFGLPATVDVEPLDVDLSTVQVSADKVFRLKPPAEGLLHIEPQSSWDGGLADRIQLYNSLLHDRYGGPVYSVALLLRREANATAVTGSLIRKFHDGREYLRFEYEVIRVWELPAEPLMNGGFGELPLALLTDEATGRLKEFVERIDRKMRDANLSENDRQTVLTSGYILLGMRYDDGTIRSAYTGVTGMKESTTYQAILKEGRQEGLQEGKVIFAHDLLVGILKKRFGNLPAGVQERINSVSDPVRLEAAVHQAYQVASVADFNP